MRKVCLLIVLLSFVTGNLWSQTTTWIQPDNWLLSKPSRYGVNGAKGTPDLFESYLPAIIYLKNGREINNISINIFNQDDMVVSKPYKGADALYDIEENDITHFVVTVANGDTRTFERFEKTAFASSFASKGFYELLTENKSFVLRTFKEFKKAEKVGGYSSGQVRDEFILVNQYYLKTADQTKYKDLKLSKKSISKALGSQAAEAKALMKKNGWKWNNALHIQLMIEQLQVP